MATPDLDPAKLRDRLRAIETQLAPESAGAGSILILARDVTWMAATILSLLARLAEAEGE